MDLTGLPALDFAIGLSFVFLLLSVFASAIQEYIAGILNLRAKTLEKGLANMLEAFPEEAEQAGEPAAVNDEASAAPITDLKTRLYEHPLIRCDVQDGPDPALDEATPVVHLSSLVCARGPRHCRSGRECSRLPTGEKRRGA